jgi:hypothetical protein
LFILSIVITVVVFDLPGLAAAQSACTVASLLSRQR